MRNDVISNINWLFLLYNRLNEFEARDVLIWFIEDFLKSEGVYIIRNRGVHIGYFGAYYKQNESNIRC